MQESGFDGEPIGVRGENMEGYGEQATANIKRHVEIMRDFADWWDLSEDASLMIEISARFAYLCPSPSLHNDAYVVGCLERAIDGLIDYYPHEVNEDGYTVLEDIVHGSKSIGE